MTDKEMKVAASSRGNASDRDSGDYYAPEVLAKSNNFMVTYHRLVRGADTLVVTFGEIDSKLTPTGFASELCFKSGVDHVYVAQRPRTQYQFLSREQLLSTLSYVSRGKRVVMYGSSLGAYCAIYYAGVLNADALAFSPRVPAHPAIDSIMDHGFRNRGFRHSQLHSGERTKGRVVIFFDPDNHIDSFYVNSFVRPAYPSASYHEIKGAGHYTARALALSGELKRFAQRFFEGKPETNYSLDYRAILNWQTRAASRRLRGGRVQHALENFRAVCSSPAISHDDKVRYSRKFLRSKKAISAPRARSSKLIGRIGQRERELIADSVKVLFVGDLILLRDQLLNSYDEKVGGYNFEPMFSHVMEYISESDFSIGVFGGPTAGAEFPLSTSSYADGIPLRLNYPDGFAEAVKDAGFSLVTLAQNHILDCGPEGALRTVDVLDDVGLEHIGCYRNLREKSESKIVNVGGLSIGFLAYTIPSNGYKSEFFFRKESSHITSVLVSPSDPNFPQAKRQVLDDLQRMKGKSPDCIVVLPHMGAQFRHAPDAFQKAWCDVFVEGGADLILSDHPHAVQPFEWRASPSGGDVLVVHCPGNFVNSYVDRDGDISALVQVYLSKSNGKPVAASAVPLYAYAYYGKSYMPIPMRKLLDESSGAPRISQHEFKRISEGHEIFSHSMLGEVLPVDHIQDKYFVFAHRVEEGNRSGYMRSPVEALCLESWRQTRLVDSLSKARSACFVGDSVTEGTRNGGYGWHEPLVGGFPDLEVAVVAKGDKGSPYFAGLASEFASLKADVYVFALGANDVRYRDPGQCAMTAEDFVENVRLMVRKVREENSSADLFFLAPWCSDDHDPVSKLGKQERVAMISEYSAALESSCDGDHGIYFIDQNEIISRAFTRKDPRFYLVDHIHPNANQGIRLYAQAVVASSP